MTTVQPDYATVNDLSNICMFDLYAKLGLDRPGAKGGVLHIDTWPQRIDKPVAEKRYGSNIFSKVRVPLQLRQIWDEYTFDLLNKSEANFGLVLGCSSLDTLDQYFRTHQIDHELVFETDAYNRLYGRSRRKIDAVKELAADGSLRRLWISTYHPEHFMRSRTFNVTENSLFHRNTLRERLIDYSICLAFGFRSPRPGYLSTMGYFKSRATGTVLSCSALASLSTAEIGTVSKHLARPGPFLLDQLKWFLEQNSSSLMDDDIALAV